MRLAVLADIHGNLLALNCVIADLATRRVDTVVNLGDCVSGPLWPHETLELVRRQGWPTVRGNHDRCVGCDDRETLGASDRYAFDALDHEERHWLRDRPALLRIADGILALHACPDHDNAYLLEDQQDGRLVRASAGTVAARLGRVEARVVLTAHSHLAGVLALPDGPLLVNPGSVGCPAYADDATTPPHVSESGSPGACYAIVDVSSGRHRIEFLCLSYDHRAAAARAAENGRPDWAFALTTGFARPETTRAS